MEQSREVEAAVFSTYQMRMLFVFCIAFEIVIVDSFYYWNILNFEIKPDITVRSLHKVDRLLTCLTPQQSVTTA